MILIKNVIVTFKNHQFFRAKYYNFFNKVIDEIVQNHFLQLQNKLLCIQQTLWEVQYFFPFVVGIFEKFCDFFSSSSKRH
jgi:hypothetical protein